MIYRFHQPDIHLYKSSQELLRQLRLDGYKLGVITDGRPEGQHAKIQALKLNEFMDYIIITDELGGIDFRKPNRAAYVKMCDQLGVTYRETCYVGDNINKDFIAPELLGIRSIWLKNSDGLYYC